MSSEIDERLDRIVGLLEIAFATQLQEARQNAREDEVTAAVLELSTNWTSAHDLHGAAARKSGASERTVQRRVSELHAQHALAARGAKNALEYPTHGGALMTADENMKPAPTSFSWQSQRCLPRTTIPLALGVMLKRSFPIQVSTTRTSPRSLARSPTQFA